MKKKLNLQALLAPAALVILYVFFAVFGKNFFDAYTLKTILESSYYVGFMAFGVTFVIIRKDLIGSSERPLQTMVNYATHYPEEARNHSMFNTPPVLPIFVMHETLKWVKAQGGVEAMYKINKKKAETLYNEIDRNSMFVGTAVKEDRSMMNVCFVMAPGHEDLEAEFMAFAKEKGMVGIKGHRSVGGFRASIYNACPQESVDALVACMQEFEKNHKK